MAPSEPLFPELLPPPGSPLGFLEASVLTAWRVRFASAVRVLWRAWSALQSPTGGARLHPEALAPPVALSAAPSLLEQVQLYLGQALGHAWARPRRVRRSR